MKNSKGISLITLIITIIVLILISSITLYTGGNMIEQSRVRNANDRLLTVATAIASHEEELGFADVVVGSESGDYRLLGIDDYEIMGLDDFKNDEHMPPIYIYKSGDYVNSSEKVYKLKTPKVLKTSSAYQESDYVYQEYKFFDGKNRQNIKVEFDTVKGVNRPLLTKDMMPVKTYYDNNGFIYSEPVNDIYEEDWYNYSSIAPNWANVKMNNNIFYVWIPRFAYKIQEFYLGTDYANVPSSAIDIIFLKGTTDYMSNEEVLPSGYQVHPAFKFIVGEGETSQTINLPGFWVAKYNVNNLVDAIYDDDSGILQALEEVKLSNLHRSGDYVPTQLESNLLKNTEWAAIAYLSFATAGKTNDGSSLQNNPSAVMDLNIPQFVGGVLIEDGSEPDEREANFDIYSIANNGKLLYKTSEDKQMGDAIIATSSGASENSTWYNGTSIRISEEKPYIIRGVDNCIFSYSASVKNPDIGAGCRNTLYVN